MRKVIFFAALLFSAFSYGQANCDKLKSENEALKIEKNALKQENDYLRKVLEVNKPIKEEEKDGVNAKITKVEGNLKEKTVYITFLLEAKINNRSFFVPEANIVDLEGNTMGIDYSKLVNNDSQKKLTLGVPTKMRLAFSYKTAFENGIPSVIKLVRVAADNEDESYSLDGKFRTKLEFRDLDVVWK